MTVIAPPRTTARPLAVRTVDHAAIARNVGRLRTAAGVPVMAVVKADAFGHGAVEVARTVLAAGAVWLGVATIDEALALRAAGINEPIFAWLIDPWCDLTAAIAQGVTVSCANLETLAAIRDAAAGLGQVAEIHLELDTGMARGGSTAELWDGLCAAAVSEHVVHVGGIWSHLALAGRPGERSIRGAIELFRRGVAAARRVGLEPRELHLANSAATLEHPSARLTMVRAGAAVYGIETVSGRRHGLEPALRLVSRVTQLRRVVGGTGVGYLHAYRTAAATSLALIPIGYGDGVPRALSDRGFVSIGGRRYPIRGTISMDQLVVEVDDRVRLGDEVVLLGDPDRGEPTAAEWAELAQTIPHEILTGFGGRIAREHVGRTPA